MTNATVSRERRARACRIAPLRVTRGMRQSTALSRKSHVTVNYSPPTPQSLLPVKGVRLGTAAARIKNWERDDLVLVACDPGTVAAGVFTQNRFCAAPVIVCREHLARQHARSRDTVAFVINAGNANAGTGDAGLADARATCDAAAVLMGAPAEAVLAYSTGVIMEPFPVDRLVAALPAAHHALSADNWLAAARAIMTTDTVPKAASRQVTVDGDTSTNDSLVLAATGQAKIAPIVAASDPRLAALRVAVEGIAVTLAQAIVRDGEGATKFIAIAVENGADVGECAI